MGDLNQLVIVKYRMYIAEKPHDYPIRSDLEYPLKYKPGDKIAVLLDCLQSGDSYPIGVNMTYGQVGCISHISHLILDPDEAPPTKLFRVHGLVNRFPANKSERPDDLGRRHDWDADAHRRCCSSWEPFLLIPPSTKQFQGQTKQSSTSETLPAELRICLFNLHTRRQTSASFLDVQLLPNHRYKGSRTILDSSLSKEAFTRGELATITILYPRYILIGKQDSIKSIYCINPGTGFGAWVSKVEDIFEPLGNGLFQALSWSSRTLYRKRRLGKSIQTPTAVEATQIQQELVDVQEKSDSRSIGSSESCESNNEDDTYYDEYDPDNQRLESYQSSPSVDENDCESDDGGPAPLQTDRQLLPNSRHILTRISLGAQTQTPSEIRENRDRAMRDDWYGKHKPQCEGACEQDRVRDRYHWVPGCTIMWSQIDIEGHVATLSKPHKRQKTQFT